VISFCEVFVSRALLQDVLDARERVSFMMNPFVEFAKIQKSSNATILFLE
jgi:hypothetical protein